MVFGEFVKRLRVFLWMALLFQSSDVNKKLFLSSFSSFTHLLVSLEATTQASQLPRTIKGADLKYFPESVKHLL